MRGRCLPACQLPSARCGESALCRGVNHQPQCYCPDGTAGDPVSSCRTVGCSSDSQCPAERACVNSRCELPCEQLNPCRSPAVCRSSDHSVACICPADHQPDGNNGCIKLEIGCRSDSECPPQTACINSRCADPCVVYEPCAEHATCRLVDTTPVRTISCQCRPGYQGNATSLCEPVPGCPVERGFLLAADDQCVCPPLSVVNETGYCVPCDEERGMAVNAQGRCVCAEHRGLILNSVGECVCPEGITLVNGGCVGVEVTEPPPECTVNSDCPQDKYCERSNGTCAEPCVFAPCGLNAECSVQQHEPVCRCIPGHAGDAYTECRAPRTDGPAPTMLVNCLHDGVRVDVNIADPLFNGLMYVKGHSQQPECRRTLGAERTQSVSFKVLFNTCGLIHVAGEAQFVLVIQKHPTLVTAKALAYQVRCVYNTGDQTVDIGFNVSMFTTAGTIANTGPPPTCTMSIVSASGGEVSSARIGEPLLLQIAVEPRQIYGGFARSCVATTVDNSTENDYPVTDERGCSAEPPIFGEWSHDPQSGTLRARFNAFKFQNADNIKFRCNVRVCFGKCQPVNCDGIDAFGRRRRRSPQLLEQSVVTRRQEIRVESNALLTLEQQFSADSLTDTRNVRVSEAGLGADEVCVSKLGFIIALIITALLALVAVAVAVSCWLMSYRGGRTSHAPLPHPAEFPNPLYTTPEPLAEPSPDYQH